MGESVRGFGLMRISKLKKIKKNDLLNMMVPNSLYTNSTLLIVTRTTRTESFTFFEEFFCGPFHAK